MGKIGWKHYCAKGSKSHERDIKEVTEQMNVGWSFHMACAKSNLSYEYGAFLRKLYPDFNDYVLNDIESRRIKGFS